MEDDIVTSDIHTIVGSLTLSGFPEDGYYQNLMHSSMPEQDVLTFMSLLLTEGATMLDVGANIGLMVVAAGKIVGSKGRIIGFEPSPQNFDILKRNVKLNDLSKTVQLHNFGLSDASRKLKLHYSNKNRGGAFIANMHKNEVYELEEEIETKKLDSMINTLDKKCDLLKVDIEGHEPFFLKGATAYIRQYKPATLMEANPWCLDAISNVTLPSYLAQIYDLYPYVYAFDEHEIVNVRERQTYFMHENIVKQHLQNLYCDFDKSQVIYNVARYKRFLNSDKLYSQELEARNKILLDKVVLLENELEMLKTSTSHRIAIRANKIIGRKN